MGPVNLKRNILVDNFSTSGLRYREAYSALFFVCLFFLLLFCLFFFFIILFICFSSMEKKCEIYVIKFPIETFLNYEPFSRLYMGISSCCGR